MLNQQWVRIADDTNVLSSFLFLSALGSIHFYPNWQKVVTNWHVHLVTTFQSIQQPPLRNCGCMLAAWEVQDVHNELLHGMMQYK